MSSHTPPTYPGTLPQDNEFHQSAHQDQRYYPQQGKLSPQPSSSRQPGTHPLLQNWPWIAAIIVALILGYGSGNYMGQATPNTAILVQPTATTQATSSVGAPVQIIPTSAPTEAPIQPTPTSAPTGQSQWVTTHTFSGNGAMKTENFTVSDNWKMQWTCNPASSSSGQYPIFVEVNNADGTLLDPLAFNTTCKAGVTSSSTQEHQGGNVYLAITTGGNFMITVQEQE